MIRLLLFIIPLLLMFGFENQSKAAPLCQSIFVDAKSPMSVSDILSREQVSPQDLENFILSYLDPTEASEFRELLAEIPSTRLHFFKSIHDEKTLVTEVLKILEQTNQTRFDKLRHHSHWLPHFDSAVDLRNFESFLLEYQKVQMSFLRTFEAEVNNFQFQGDPRNKALFESTVTYLLKGFLSYDLVLFRAMRNQPGEFQSLSKNQILLLGTEQGARSILSATTRYYGILLGIFAACLVPDIFKGVYYYKQLMSIPIQSPVMNSSMTDIRDGAQKMLDSISTPSERSAAEQRYLKDFQQALDNIRPST